MAIVSPSVFALDIASVSPVVGSVENNIAIGKRVMFLPKLPWSYIAYSKGSYNIGNISTPRHTGYFSSVSENKFNAGVVLEMGESTVQMNKWLNDSCKMDGNLYKSTLESTVIFPECIVVNRRQSLHKGASGDFYKQVVEWYSKNSVDQSISIFDVTFIHYSSIGQGFFRIFLPETAFGSEKAVIDWAVSLPGVLRPFMQGRTDTVTLPNWQ
jgi:hypothetical protein